MNDPTEGVRRLGVMLLNGDVESQDVTAERERLEDLYGQVWNMEQLEQDFDVVSFLAPYIMVREKSTGDKGTMMFQHSPRFYFGYKA